MVTLRRAFVVAWILLGLAGALDHTIAEKLLGRRYDLWLPHLKYGHVMFNVNLREIQIYEYAAPDGVRHPLADLVQTPAIGYRDARAGIDVFTKPDYLRELCFRAFRAKSETLVFFRSDYQVDVDPRTPARTDVFVCDAHGLAGY